MLTQVFSKKIGGKLLRMVAKQGQTGWLESANGGERTIVFGDKERNAFYCRERFSEIMVEVRAIREARKRAERDERKYGQRPMDRLLRRSKSFNIGKIVPHAF